MRVVLACVQASVLSLVLFQEAIAFLPPRRMAALPSAGRQSSRFRVTPRSLFSGIVEEMGSVLKLERNPELKLWDGSVGEGTELTIEANVVLEGAYLGASIAINGVCTTVTELEESSFKVGLAPETLRRSNLGSLSTGSPVNLERSLPADGRNSGHFVQGHVDCTGTILSKDFEGESLWVKIAAPPELMRLVVPKGYIAVDGTSLTVCDVNQAEGWFTFMLIAYTQKHIIVPQKEVGDQVNLEADVLGKYIERSMSTLLERVETLEAKLAALSRSRGDAVVVGPAGLLD